MKLDRNTNDDGVGKYAVINMRRLDSLCGHPSTFERWTPAVTQAFETLDELGVLEWGQAGSENEFFLLKLKDRHSAPALDAYARSVQNIDPEFAAEVHELATRSGSRHPHCKEPD